MDDLAVAVASWMALFFVAGLTIGYAIRSLISLNRRARAARYRVGWHASMLFAAQLTLRHRGAGG
jgi:hypothetical protein